MKALTRILAVLLLAFTIAIPAVIITGCKATTVSQQRKTFNTVWSLAESVDTSYKAYLDLVISGQLKTNSVPKVSLAYSEFQTSLGLALVVVAGNSNAAPPVGLLMSATKFTATINTANKP